VCCTVVWFSEILGVLAQSVCPIRLFSFSFMIKSAKTLENHSN